MSLNKVSIIICFHNAALKLEATLFAIKNLNTENIDKFELILVNNNSNDNSKEIILKCLKGFTKFNWQIVDEPKPGLSNARLKGIETAKHEVLLFCDDDNWFDEDYLEKGLNILNSDSQIAVLGGQGRPVSEIKFPEWFKENSTYYAVGPQTLKSGLVKGDKNVVYGAGMFIRKSYFIHLISIGFKSFSLDRKGSQLSSGGDSEICLAFQVAGYKIWYDENLTFSHFIENNKLTLDYINRLKKGISTSRFLTRFYLDYLQGYKPTINSFFWVKELIHTIKEIILMAIKTNKMGLYRAVSFLTYLLRERNNYNKNVLKIYELCRKLEASNKVYTN